jgi:hypothetical protein
LAGFQVIIYGRFWVFTEGNAIGHSVAQLVINWASNDGSQ